MSEITAGFKARLEYVLDQVCMEAPDGGSHEMRCFVAEKLMTAAQAENVLSKGSRKSRAKLWLPSADSSPRRPLETTSLARRMAAEQVKKQQPHRF